MSPSIVTPSIVDPAIAEPFTLEQELEPFRRLGGQADLGAAEGCEHRRWPRRCCARRGRLLSKEKRWAAVVEKHRSDFTQVREFDLFQASIRLPQGKFFVTVTEQKDFDKITDTIPACVQTRLDEFLSGPGHEAGREGLLPQAAVRRDRRRADPHHARRPHGRHHQGAGRGLREYRRLALYRRPLQALVAAANRLSPSSRGGEVRRRAQAKSRSMRSMPIWNSSAESSS